MRSCGDGDLRGKNKGITTEVTEDTEEYGIDRSKVSLRVLYDPLVKTFDGSDKKFTRWSELRSQSPSAREEERNHGAGWRCSQGRADCSSGGRQGQRRLHRILCKLLNVPRLSVTIAACQTSRNKVIRVAGLIAQQVRDRLGN